MARSPIISPPRTAICAMRKPPGSPWASGGGVAASPAFGARVERVIHGILQRPRDAALIAGDVVEMRAAIAKEKGDGERWDLKYVAGGLIDLEFLAQYLQLIHAPRLPAIFA